MKKYLLSVLCILLVAVMALALVACGGDKAPDAPASKVNPDDPVKDVSVYNSGKGYDTINDPLSWEAINEFPVVHDGMTIDEGRDLVVDFFRYAKTAVWMPADDYEYTVKSGSEPKYITGAVKYGGLPYTSVSSGNIYRLMDYMDPDTHVVDIKLAGAKKTLFGNQCSFGSYIGIGRVINSADYSWTKGMTLKAGFLKVGDYIYDENTEEYKQGLYNTENILDDNGEEKMFECYAGLKKGDVIVYYTSAGHVVMISEDAHVVRDPETGKIDPRQSYVKVIDQTPGTVTDGKNAAGDVYTYEKNVDAKWDFTKLFNGEYVPFTFAEWTGADPIESSKTEISHTGDTVSLNQINGITVTSNYGITDVYASIYNANGVEVYKIAVRSTTTSVKEVKMAIEGFNVDLWGNKDSLKPDTYEYTVKISAQLSTGERPVLWEGKLVA